MKRARRFRLAQGRRGDYMRCSASFEVRLSNVAARPHAPVFTQGNLMRHVAVMTATGSIGLIAIFSVDVLSLFWVSRLGVDSYKAAIGYSSQLSFVLMSVNIGLTIAISAQVSRALGAGDRPLARRMAASGLLLTFLATLVLSTALWFGRDYALEKAMHAQGPARDVASGLLAIIIPANVPMGLGMALSGVLRACGDARRAMYVTLMGGVVTAFTDPLLIFGFGLGVYGAAWATLISRLVFLGVGYSGAVRVHNLVGRPSFGALRQDFRALGEIGWPSILANLATPVSAIYVTRVWSDFGEATVAGGAIVDRVIPLAFGVIFALTGSIGPIIGQNYGARLMPRVRRALSDSFVLAVGYAIIAWGALALAAPLVVSSFEARGPTAEFVLLFCRYGAMAWVFVTCLFVANTAFNNLGFARMAMLFNWGRATLGTIPFVLIGSRWGGVPGAMVGLILGAAIFGLGGVAMAYWLVGRLASRVEAE
jgi:putative MATE family efflux protein